MVTFRRGDRGRVAAGEITVTFRLWKTAKVKAGKAYQTGIGTLHVDSVEVMPAGAIVKRDVQFTGCKDISAIWNLAGEHTGATITAETLLHRVQFRFLGDVGPLTPLQSIADYGTIASRLARMDARSTRGPWTHDVLRMIERAPRVSARVLAAEMEWERLDFKAHVRRLKALGLTISHEIGYELSDLGRGYVASLNPPQRSGSGRSPRTRARSRS
jgi:hypothetical protein